MSQYTMLGGYKIDVETEHYVRVVLIQIIQKLYS